MTVDLPANIRLVEELLLSTTELLLLQSCLYLGLHNINTVRLSVLSLSYNVSCYPNITNDKNWPTLFSPELS